MTGRVTTSPSYRRQLSEWNMVSGLGDEDLVKLALIALAEYQYSRETMLEILRLLYTSRLIPRRLN